MSRPSCVEGLGSDPVVLWRRAEEADVSAVSAMCQRRVTRRVFGDVSVARVLQMSYLSLVQVTQRGKLASSLSLHYAPNVATVPSADWESWIRELYGLHRTTARNTLFVHLLTASCSYGSSFAALLTNIYHSYQYLQNIVVVMPPGISPSGVLVALFTHVMPTAMLKKAQTLLLNTRERHIPRLHVRLANPEDNDDVGAVLCHLAVDLCTQYGNLFISELSERNEEEAEDADEWEPPLDIDPSDVRRNVIVAEVEERVVAVMTMNDEVDLDFLDRCFQLEPYHHLRQPTATEVTTDNEADPPDVVKKARSPKVVRISTPPSSSDASLDTSPVSFNRTGGEVPLQEIILPLGNDYKLAAMQQSKLEQDYYSIPGTYRPSWMSAVSTEDTSEVSSVYKHPFSRKRLPSTRSYLSDLGSFLRDMAKTQRTSSPLTLYDSSSSSSGSSSQEYMLYDDSEWLEDMDETTDLCLATEEREIVKVPFYLTNLADVTFERKVALNMRTKDTKEQPRRPTPVGACNAFVIELFGISDNYDERLAFDLLQAAFELYPDREFCLLMLPSTFPTFSLLQHFARILPRPHWSNGEQQLFAAHRSSVLDEMTVRPGRSNDKAAVGRLLKGVDLREVVLEDFVAAVEGSSENLAFVMKAESVVVGVAVLQAERWTKLLEAHYELPPDVLFDGQYHGSLTHMLVSPIFEPHSRFFLRELLRLTGVTALFYRLCALDKKLDWTTPRSMPTFLDSMVPVVPRKSACFGDDAWHLGENMPVADGIDGDDPYSLYVLSPRYASFPRMCIHTRIVVIGPSNTALAFLVALLYNPKSAVVLFTNVTLVSPHGMPGERPPRRVPNPLRVRRSTYTYQHMSRMNLRTMVHLVSGVMTDIERNLQFVVINQDFMVPYDQLVITCGEQFQCPRYTDPLAHKVDYRCPHEMAKEGDVPKLVLSAENVFYINSQLQATSALSNLKRLMTRAPLATVIVYGHCLEAYAAVHDLLSFGVRPSQLAFVNSFDVYVDQVTCFDDALLEKHVQNSILILGVTIYNDFTFSHWTLATDNRTVQTVTFCSKSESLTLDCAALFYYSDRSVHRYTFFALNHAKLLLLNRLFINHRFETNDPKILAAGTMTRYNSEYEAEALEHRYYDSIEVGEHLAKRVLIYWDPTLSEEERLLEFEKLENESLIPHFKQPLTEICTLPGNMNYLKIRHPGPNIPRYAEKEFHTFGFDFETGNPDNGTDYLKFSFNDAYSIVELTCYFASEIDFERMLKLYYKPAELFRLQDKCLTYRFSNTMDFWKLPQWSAMYHERFQQFFEDLKKAIMVPVDPPGLDLGQAVTDLLEQNLWKIPPREDVNDLKSAFRLSAHMDTVRKKTVEFLEANADCLPMYATPEVVQNLLRGTEDSPLWTPAL